MSESHPTVYLARHGETAWTISRQHTGRTDLPLTARGEDDAWSLHGRLRGVAFDRVFVSPLRRARQTSLLARFGDEALTVADLTEFVPDRTVPVHGVARPPERPAPTACPLEMRR